MDSSSSNHVQTNNTAKSSNKTKKTPDNDLKNSIIDFMRERPFLWNSKHPSYKDHKRRVHEFQAFSNTIGIPTQEIKRVWHVLRTNFFRAHKLLMDRPINGENGEKFWKYYLNMKYILIGTDLEEDNESLTKTRPTRSSKGIKHDSRSSKRESNCQSKNVTGSDVNSSATSETNLIKTSGNNNGTQTFKNNLKHSIDDYKYFNDPSMDADDDLLYARSLTSTLKKFDPTTKEIVKLKFQEIIVDHMQRQQHHQLRLQQQNDLIASSKNVPDISACAVQTNCDARAGHKDT